MIVTAIIFFLAAAGIFALVGIILRMRKKNIKWWILGELVLLSPGVYFGYRWLETRDISEGGAFIVFICGVVLVSCGIKLFKDGLKGLEKKGRGT